MSVSRRLLSGSIYLLAILIGVATFAYPFLQPALERSAMARATPVLTTLLLVACLAALLVEIQGQAASAKVVASLGMLVAVASVLRFLETAIPGPGGFAPVFAPIILAGYVFGARFGFLMGTFTMLVSALVSAGVGPWLPYQMFVAAWMGYSAGWLPRVDDSRLELGLLVLFGIFWGFLYGFITNLYFWPFFAGEAALSYRPGSGFAHALGRYLSFYVATSLLWDLLRAVGNAGLLLILGGPAVRALARFRDRFAFTVEDDAQVVSP